MDTSFDKGQASPPEDNRFFGVTIAIVTANKDEEGLGRVKVEFPGLFQEMESQWARVATPMAGKQMGMFFLPEVGDEVLVAFQHGIIDYPYVIGSLWNGKITPPETNSDGKNNLRFIKSSSGHIIRLDDSDGKEKIEVIDKSGKNTIVIDVSTNTITITAEGSIELKAKQDIKLESTEGDVKIIGKSVTS
jgi:uncharacterized protein involved in type VI secretion and phage assembly